MNNEPHAENLRPENITLEMLENGDPRVTPELIFGSEPGGKLKEPSKTADVSELLKLLGQGKPAVAPESTKPEISGSQAKLLREMAQYYLKNNISIIPVGKNKRPLIVWKEYQERKATLEEVDAWFKQFPDMQIGIVTGKISNLIVVDVEKGGDPSWLPPTAVAKTGGDGWHYYYSYVPGVTNKARIRELIDIRGDGGYCIAPPSCSDKGNYEWRVQTQPVIFPQYLFTDKPDSIFKPEFAMNNQQYSGAQQGSRNDSMARYIGSVLRSVHPSEWDTIGWQQVQLANSKNLPPLPDRELRTTFESIKNAERRSNQFKWQREQAHTTDPNDLWNDADDEVVHFSESARRHAVNILEKIPTGFPMFDEALGGGVNDGDLVVISGQTGHGKTTMAQTMTFNMTDQVFPCLWFSYEVLTPYLWSKFQSMGMREDTLVYIPFKHVTGNISWITKKILESKQKYFTKTVFIDHLGFLEPGLNDDRRMSRDNYSLYMGRICRELKRLAVQEKIIIVLLAHLKKTEEESVNDLYGSVAIGQESDAVFMVKRELEADEGAQEYFTPYTKITLMKNRKTGQTVKAWFTMSDEKLLWQPDYVPIPRAKKNRYRGPIKVYGERD